MEGLTAEWATREYHRFIAAAPQLIALPLTQCYGEWKSSGGLTERMDMTLRLGYSLQFCSIPPPFRGMREANLSVIPGGDRFPLGMCTLKSERRGTIPSTSWFQEDRRIQAHSGSSQPESPHCTQKIPYVNFKTVDGTGAARRLVHNHRPEGRLLRKYLPFAFQGVAYEYNRLPFGYSLSPRTFRKCVATAWQPLRDHGMRVFFYLDDLIVIHSGG